MSEDRQADEVSEYTVEFLEKSFKEAQVKLDQAVKDAESEIIRLSNVLHVVV